jgi:hypothetical protein
VQVLSDESRRRVDLLFHERDRKRAALILDDGFDIRLPVFEGTTEAGLERLQFAALKVSGGDISKLRSAIELGRIDWRDLLLAAGFGADVEAHKHWLA